jgi:hypothetical protein
MRHPLERRSPSRREPGHRPDEIAQIAADTKESAQAPNHARQTGLCVTAPASFTSLKVLRRADVSLNLRSLALIMRLFIPAIFLLGVCTINAADKPWPEPDVAFFTKLRMEYAKQPDFNPMWKVDAARDAIITAYKTKDYTKVIELSKPWLAKCPVDADIHYLCAQALTMQGDIAHYAHHLYYFYGLIQSIASSGDGANPKTAFKVISIAEEYYLLRDFGAELLSQRLQDNCDVMRCKLQDGKEVTYYFDASIALAAESRLLIPKK